MQKRFPELDIVRGIAIIGVVAIHSTSFDFTNTSLLLTLINQGFRFTTPGFLILSGIVLSLSQQAKPLSNFQFYKKRMLRIIVPYIICSILLTFIYDKAFSEQVLKHMLSNILTGRADYPYYFLIILLQAYIIFPFIYWLLSKLSTKRQFTLLLVVFLAQWLLLWRQDYLRFVLGSSDVTEFTYRFIGSWFFYLLAGAVIGLHYQKFVQTLKNLTGAIVWIVWLGLLALLCYEVLVFHIRYYEYNHFFRTTILIYTAVTLIGLLQWAIRHNDKQIFLTLAGKHSYGIFLIHVFILGIALKPLSFFSHPIFCGLLFCWTFFVSLGFLLIVAKVQPVLQNLKTAILANLPDSSITRNRQ